MKYVNYAPDVEKVPAGEAETIDRIGKMMLELAERSRDKQGAAMKGTHAKAVGLLKGELIVHADLPSELAQGLFARPAVYEALVRYAPGPPEKLSDKASGQRGMSIKLLGVSGAHVAESDERSTQDFVLAVDPAFNSATAEQFLAVFSRTAAKTPLVPEAAIVLGSRLARGAEAMLEAVGLESANLKFIGRPPRHPVSDAYYSQAAIRYGEHVAKLAVFPSERTLEIVGDPAADTRDDEVFRHLTVTYFEAHEASYDVRVQLCTDLGRMPVEDASVTWSEAESPYRSVATLRLAPQRAFTPEREVYFDDRLSFNPAHSLEEHRPLGSIMRARMAVYKLTTAFRQAANDARGAEPATLSEVPD